jgi:hypothetical protein
MPMKALLGPHVWQTIGLASAVLLAILLVGTETGRDALAWMYLTAADGIASATHIHTFLLDRFDPTCPQCL